MLSISVNPLSKLAPDGVCAVRGKAVMTTAARSKNLRELDIILFFAPSAATLLRQLDQRSNLGSTSSVRTSRITPSVYEAEQLSRVVARIGPKIDALNY